jgi:tetratricopeptide (TPR) repeat protein
MQNTIAQLVRLSAIAGFIFATPPLRAQALEVAIDHPAQQLLRQGDTFTAIRQLRAAEARNPRDGNTVLLLAYAYYLAGQKRLFAQKAAAAVPLLPQSPEPHYALGRYYLDDVGRCDRASAEFRLALARNPEHASALYHLGWCHELDQQPEEAARLYTRASSWLGHLGLARLALAAQQPEKALASAQTAARLQPDAFMVHALLGKIRQSQGDCRQAIPAFERAAALDPTDAPILYQLARCAATLGNSALQRETLRRYERLRALYN